MFPDRYFPPRYFPPTYFPRGSGGPTPPAPPTPSNDQDGGALIGFGHTLTPADAARRFYWREKVDPWAAIRMWLRGLNGQAAQEWKVNQSLIKQRTERDLRGVTTVSRISRLMRRKRG